MCVTYIDFSRFKACFGAGKVEFIIIYLELKDGETFALSGKYFDYEHRLLDDGRFIKTGRSQLLNADRISAVTHEGFLLDNGKEISLGRRVRERTYAEYIKHKAQWGKR